MATASKVGRACKVVLGSAQVDGIGDWSISGFAIDQLDDTEFGDLFKQTLFTGLRGGEQVTFAGLFRPADVTGQIELEQALVNGESLTTLKLYIDSTSYYEPCQTTGYLSPSSTSGNNTVLSHATVISHSINADKAGLLQVSFTALVTGKMVLI